MDLFIEEATVHLRLCEGGKLLFVFCFQFCKYFVQNFM